MGAAPVVDQAACHLGASQVARPQATPPRHHNGSLLTVAVYVGLTTVDVATFTVVSVR